MRKVIWLLVGLLISANIAAAQSVSASADTAPKISISKLKWSKKARVPRAGGGRSDSTTPALNSGGTLPEQNPTFTPPKIREFYAYEADFKNETEKEIKGFVWNYVFLDADGKKELEREEFFYPYKVEKNKQITSRNEVSSPPLRVISAGNLKKDSFHERAEITCVIFDDDSAWMKSDVPKNTCEKLKNIIKRQK